MVGPSAHEKMLEVISRQGNTNQSHNETPHRIHRMATTKKTNNTCYAGCGETGTLTHCWWERKMVQLLWKIVWHFPKKLNIHFPMAWASLVAQMVKNLPTIWET